MKSDLELMTAAVYANPLDETARMALADEMAAHAGTTEGSVYGAKYVALTSRIDAFVKELDSIMVAHWDERRYTFSPPPTHEAIYKGKWCLIVKHNKTAAGANCGSSATAFVALEDFANKELGAVAMGDIHKPASYKKPARHAHGNVFRPDFGNCVGPSGHVHYLR